MYTIIATQIRHHWTQLRQHLDNRRQLIQENPDGGYTTETVIITALLIGLGLTALGILAAKVTDKANGLTF